jgi:hypothetical protein
MVNFIKNSIFFEKKHNFKTSVTLSFLNIFQYLLKHMLAQVLNFNLVKYTVWCSLNAFGILISKLRSKYNEMSKIIYLRNRVDHCLKVEC